MSNNAKIYPPLFYVSEMIYFYLETMLIQLLMTREIIDKIVEENEELEIKGGEFTDKCEFEYIFNSIITLVHEKEEELNLNRSSINNIYEMDKALNVVLSLLNISNDLINQSEFFRMIYVKYIILHITLIDDYKEEISKFLLGNIHFSDVTDKYGFDMLENSFNEMMINCRVQNIDLVFPSHVWELLDEVFPSFINILIIKSIEKYSEIAEFDNASFTTRTYVISVNSYYMNMFKMLDEDFLIYIKNFFKFHGFEKVSFSEEQSDFIITIETIDVTYNEEE